MKWTESIQNIQSLSFESTQQEQIIHNRIQTRSQIQENKIPPHSASDCATSPSPQPQNIQASFSKKQTVCVTLVTPISHQANHCGSGGTNDLMGTHSLNFFNSETYKALLTKDVSHNIFFANQRKI